MLILLLGSTILVVLSWIVASEFSSGRVRVDRAAMAPLVASSVMLASCPPLLLAGGDASSVGVITWLMGALVAIPAVSFVNVSLVRIKKLSEVGDEVMRSIGSLEFAGSGDMDRIEAGLAAELQKLREESSL